MEVKQEIGQYLSRHSIVPKLEWSHVIYMTSYILNAQDVR